MQVLENLYMGDIHPSERSFKKDSQYSKALNEVVKAGDALLGTPMSLRQRSEAKDGGTGNRSRKEKGHGKKADIVCQKRSIQTLGIMLFYR